jgi:hypothetical protein
MRCWRRSTRMQVVLEANLRLNFAQSVPAALIGCFSEDFQISFEDSEGPYDYVGNFRIDGAGGVPLGMAADHNRMNGFARTGASSTPSADPGYVQGRVWRGTQTLRGRPAASGVSNRFGGTQSANLLDTGLGPATQWLANPYIVNDPRIADALNFNVKGLALGAGGIVFESGTTGVINDLTAQRQRGFPLIAYKVSPSAANTTNAAGGFLAQSAWGNTGDDKARKGFYGCNSVVAPLTINQATELCVKGTSGNVGPDWSSTGVNASGRAFGIIQSIHRQCTGSGSSINPLTGSPFVDATSTPNGIACSTRFEWLENVAACLILPRNVANNAGTNALRPAGDSNNANNFEGCHPGCLIATDIDDNGSLGNEDRPFRSVCINLDAENLTAYGPGVLPAKGNGAPFAGALNRYGTKWRDWNVSKGIDADNAATAARFADAAAIIRPAGAIVERGNGHFITRLDMTDRGPLGTCEQNCLTFGWGKDGTYGAHRTDIASPGTVGTESDRNCVARVPNHGGGTVLEACNFDYNNDGFLDRKSYALSSSYREECADPRDGVAWGPTFNISSSNTNIANGCVNDLPNFTKRPPPITAFCDDGNDAEIREALDEIIGQAKSIATNKLIKNQPNLDDGDGWFGGARCHMGNNQRFGGSPLTHPHSGNLAGLNTVVNSNNQETVKMYFRNNPRAISDAFKAIQPPIRAVRRLQ